MVKLEEVPDEELNATQPGPAQAEDEGDWESDSESDVSETSSLADETLYDRLAALQDIVPPTHRRRLTAAVSGTRSWLGWAARIGGKGLWVVSSSALLLGVPWALAYAEEQQMQEMEREMAMQKRENEVLAPGVQTAQQQGARPAL
ncbi:mitochondrial outer membrane translocase complex, subunit Tom22 [Lineolata rhizophorae]|uniref:Mitochondrial outer membrane translocase complex, subunit Tom22 n=1 Tax=Lineolata rhizophorae TaxID=578093 RepID=A0A6A6PEE6_9PEZI|nr:mitochondrial outer membrane translocase complex, subunit Tom22 [Lineolata rhizophorae]